MHRFGAVPVLCCGLAIISLLAVGCRTEEPPDMHAGDLGGEDAVLLPTDSTFKDPEILSGKADWVDFREPTEEDEVAADAPVDGAVDTAAIEEEIRELIGEYNELVADAEASADDWLEYFIEEQYDALKPVFDASRAAGEALQQVEASLVEKKPDDAERSRAAVATLRSRLPGALPIASIAVVNEDEVTVTMAPGALIPTCRFTVVDDAWYAAMPSADALPQTKTTLDALLATYRGWVDGLSGGQATPDDVLGQVEAAAAPLPSDPQPADDAASEGG